MSATQQEQPENRYICEARETGKKSHEFPTPDHDTARAMCDAHGWELIRVYEPGKDADRPPEKPAKGDPMLSQAQIRALAIEAGKAFRLLDDMDLTEGLTEKLWRHAQVMKIVGRRGLSACQNSHYAKLNRHFLRLQGHKTVATGSEQQSSEKGDTLERRQYLMRQIATELATHARRLDNPQTGIEAQAAAHASTNGGALTEAYLMTIARGKNPEIPLHDTECLVKLTAAKLDHLLWTIKNRIATREGRPDPEKRNKSQRKNKP